jgi:hypothetical protein
MTAVAVGLTLMAISPVSGVQLLGLIVTLCGGAWLLVKRLEREDA